MSALWQHVALQYSTSLPSLAPLRARARSLSPSDALAPKAPHLFFVLQTYADVRTVAHDDVMTCALP